MSTAPDTVPAIRTTWTVTLDLATLVSHRDVEHPRVQAAYAELRETIDAAIFAAIEKVSHTPWFLNVGQWVEHASTTVHVPFDPDSEF